MQKLRMHETGEVSEREFLFRVKRVLQTLRDSLVGVLTSVGADPTEPQEIARNFGINKNLTWKISRVIRERDPLAAIGHMPGNAAFKIFLASMRKAGAPPETIDAVRDALAELGALVRTHSGDRGTFEVMVGSLTPEGAVQRSENYRKQAFRGNAATWGVQAAAQIGTHFVAPNPGDPGRLDIAVVTGLVDFKRLRADMRWAVANVRRFRDDMLAKKVDKFSGPIDPRFDGPDQAPLMGDFCSQPIPRLRVQDSADGEMRRVELEPGAVGNTAVSTCFTGWFFRNAESRWRSPNDRFGSLEMTLSTPVELAILNVFLHRELEPPHLPTPGLYNQLPSGPQASLGDPVDASLPLFERVTDQGSNPPDVIAPEFPRYPAMVQAVMDRMGWNLNEFHLYRIRMRFPPIPTLLAVSYELPERPGGMNGVDGQK